jgi:hypothetical protein
VCKDQRQTHLVVPRPGELSRISAVAERLSSYFDDEPYYLWAVPNWLCNDGLHGVIDLFYPGVPLAISLHQRGGDDQKAGSTSSCRRWSARIW